MADAELADLLAHIREVGRCAYDTEFIGETSYHPRLCLIQLATHQRLAIVDAMVDIDLTPIWELLADASVLKIVHAGQQDLEPVVRHLKREPAEVFDTQIAAGFAGMPYPVALSKLVAEVVGAKIGKGLTFTSWDHRPLSKAHLRYAADDVRYLPAIYEVLVPKLEAAGHLGWARQECAERCDEATYIFDADTHAGRVRGAKGLTGKQKLLLNELVVLRDAGARQNDVPPRTFMKDEVLLDLVRRPPKSTDHLKNVRGLPRPVEQEYGQQIVDAAQKAMSTPREQVPVIEEIEETAAQRFRNDSLWTAAQAYCMGRGIDPSIVTTRQELADFARSVRGEGSANGSRLTGGWRGELLGTFVERFLRGDVGLNMRWTIENLRSELA
jgi:ribonuclease D